MIIGAHRSGTTATARALRLLGLQMGQRLDSHEEPRELQRLHERYLRNLGASWHEPAAFLNWVQSPQGRAQCTDYLRQSINRDFARIFGYRHSPLGLALLARLKFGKPWGWKEPRTTLFAVCWLELFPDARILHVVRHPLAVATSMQKRELEFQAKGDLPTGRVDDLNHCLDLAITYLETGEGLAAQTPSYFRVRFEDVQADPQKQLTALAEFAQLRFTSQQMAKAVASIRPQKSNAWRDLPNAHALLSRYPVATRLGYE